METINTLINNVDKFLDENNNINEDIRLRDIHYTYCKFLLKNKKITLQQYLQIFPLVINSQEVDTFRGYRLIDEEILLSELLKDLYSFKYENTLSLDTNLKPTNFVMC
jgi:hypothetical protein